MRQGLEKLISMLAEISGVEDLTLTTNGYLLAKQAAALRDAGLQRITVSLDSLDEEVFNRMNGLGLSVAPVLEAIEEAARVGLHPIKINSVVQRGVNDHTILDLARRFKGTGHVVRFIEYMDVGNINGWRPDEVVSASEIVSIINAELPIEPVDPNYRGEVARRFRYLDGDGEIGIIASVSQPFCADCTRARLSTEGKIYTCLFAGVGRDLREPLRSGRHRLRADGHHRWHMGRGARTDTRRSASNWPLRHDGSPEERSKCTRLAANPRAGIVPTEMQL